MLNRATFSVALTSVLLLSAAPAFADFKLERKLALEPGGQFLLDTDAGEVTVSGDSPSGVSLIVTSSRDDLDRRYDFRFEETAGVVRVRVERRGGWMSGLFGGDWFSGRVNFAVRVPRKTSIDVRTSGGSVRASALTGSTRIHSSGGALHVEQVEGNVDARTSGGSIDARSVRGNVIANTSGGGIDILDVQGTVRADTSGGGIQIENVMGDVYADTSGGGVRVRAAAARVEAHSSGGPVTVAFGAGNNRGGELSSSGGGVRAELDPTVALSIDASSSGGGVDTELPVTTRGRLSNNSVKGDLNGGGSLLRLRSSGGGVRLASRR